MSSVEKPQFSLTDLGSALSAVTLIEKTRSGKDSPATGEIILGVTTLSMEPHRESVKGNSLWNQLLIAQAHKELEEFLMFTLKRTFRA